MFKNNARALTPGRAHSLYHLFVRFTSLAEGVTLPRPCIPWIVDTLPARAAPV